jgi:hypothetical protein
VLLVVVLLASAGCARMVPPGGGPEDKQAPSVVAHEPDSAAVAVPRDAPLKIVFDDAMDHSSVRDWLLVAPWPGKLACRWDSSCITCWPEGGWREDAVYTVLLGTEALDRRRNRLGRALEFVFTTGESLPSGSVAGVVRTRALKVQGVPVCLFPWPAEGLGDSAGTRPTPDPRDALSIAEADAQGRFRLLHVPWGEDFLLGALWDETRNRVFDEDADLWGFFPAKVRAQALAAAPVDSASAAADTAAATAAALRPGDYEVFLVYPDEPGDIAGEVSDSACVGFVPPAAHRARADSLRRVLSGEVDAMGFASQGDSASVVQLTRAEEESLRVGLARIDSLLATSVRDSLRCGGPIWVSAYAEGDTVPAGEASGTGPYQLSGLSPGVYRIEAFRDLDGNGDPGPDEPRGRFATYVELGPGRRVEGVSFPIRGRKGASEGQSEGGARPKGQSESQSEGGARPKGQSEGQSEGGARPKGQSESQSEGGARPKGQSEREGPPR